VLIRAVWSGGGERKASCCGVAAAATSITAEGWFRGGGSALEGATKLLIHAKDRLCFEIHGCPGLLSTPSTSRTGHVSTRDRFLSLAPGLMTTRDRSGSIAVLDPGAGPSKKTLTSDLHVMMY
jgi:hypothetical protein